MNPTQNPFTAMLLTYNAARIYGREHIVTSILQVITATEPNSHAIYGIRTIGKTTLLKYLKDSNGAFRHYRDFVNVEYRPGGGRRLLFAYLNCRRLNKGESLCSLMAGHLQDELAFDPLAGEIHFQQFSDSSSQQNVAHSLRAILHQLDEHGVRVVFLLDDFDVPLEFIDSNDDRLLRTLTDYAVLIIATEEPISTLRPDIGASSPLLGILRPQALGPLNEPSARLLITEPLRGAGIALTKQEQDFLLDIAGRQPFFLISACELYFNLNMEYPDLAEALADTPSRQNLESLFISRLVELPHINNALNHVWIRLSADEQEALQKFARTPDPNQFRDRQHIVAQLANKSLIHLDIKKGGYYLSSVLLTDFVQRLPATSSMQPLSDHASQLAETLSPIDRALFEYFCRHRGKSARLMSFWTRFGARARPNPSAL